MTSRPIRQGAAQPVVIYDPLQKKFLQGSATPIAVFDADGVAISFVGGDNGELQYNNNGRIDGATDIVFSNTAIELQNNATVWVDFNFGGTSLRAAATAPDFIAVNGGNVQVRGFDGNATTEQLFGQVEMDHMWKENSTIYPHVHWMPTTTDAGNVNWQMDFTVIENGATPTAELNINIVQAASGVAWQGQFASFPSIDMSGFGIGTQFAFRLFRDPTDTDTYAFDAALLTFGLHVEVNTMGSRQIATK